LLQLSWKKTFWQGEIVLGKGNAHQGSASAVTHTLSRL
jgi:hypothetical protein